MRTAFLRQRCWWAPGQRGRTYSRIRTTYLDLHWWGLSWWKIESPSIRQYTLHVGPVMVVFTYFNVRVVDRAV